MFAVNALFWLVLRDGDYLHLAIFQVCLSVYLAHSADLFHWLPDDLGVGIPGRFPADCHRSSGQLLRQFHPALCQSRRALAVLQQDHVSWADSASAQSA